MASIHLSVFIVGEFLTLFLSLPLSRSSSSYSYSSPLPLLPTHVFVRAFVCALNLRTLLDIRRACQPNTLVCLQHHLSRYCHADEFDLHVYAKLFSKGGHKVFDCRWTPLQIFERFTKGYNVLLQRVGTEPNVKRRVVRHVRCYLHLSVLA